MEKKELQDRISILKEEISSRQKELDNLNNELMKLVSFREKFMIWANSENSIQLSSLADGAVGVWCRKNLDLGSMRGCVNLLEREPFEEYAFSENLDNEYIEKIESDELFMSACAQMIKENFDSFEIDW